jgi:hypothetical protein
MKKVLYLILLLAVGCTAGSKNDPANLVFKKTDVNPVLGPDSTFVFFDPVKNDSVRCRRQMYSTRQP